MKKHIVVFVSLFTIGWLTAQSEIPIDTSMSSIKWTGSNLFKLNEHYGTVKFKQGIIFKNGDALTGGSFEVDMNSITNTDGKYNEMLVFHLKNEDFFNVKKHASAQLEITGITYADNVNLDVKAMLTIKGVTQAITYSATLEQIDDRIRMVSKFIIDRTRWNVNYESKGLLKTLKDDTISDAITFEVIVISKQND